MAERGRPRDPRGKILSAARLAKVLDRERRRGSRVVFTNGVFDLLHTGHVTLLHRARALGDVLVVAVNRDASVRALKGPGRPFVRERDRALMLASLESVDHVVLFGEPTPLRLIRKLQPDVLVKGGDWKTGSIVGGDFVRAHGGRVVRIPTVRGFSTTAIARDIGSRRRR